MARPKTPLISRRNALTAALSIMDSEGLESLSIRRLAEEMGVNGASLYHHFRNKDEILVGAARVALAEVRTPQATDEEWPVWMARNTTRLRQALIDHPGLIPIMVRRGPLGISTDMMESSAALLAKQGLSLRAVIPLLEALEFFAISSAMQANRGDGTEEIADLSHHDHPTLTQAAALRDINSAEVFEAVVDRIIEAVVRLESRTTTPAPATPKAKRPPRPAATAAPVAGPKRSTRSAAATAVGR